MRFQRSFVAEQLVEQKLRRVFLVSADQEEFRAGIALRFRQETVEDGGDLVGKSFPGLSLRYHEQAAAADDIAHCLLVHCIFAHVHHSLVWF